MLRARSAPIEFFASATNDSTSDFCAPQVAVVGYGGLKGSRAGDGFVLPTSADIGDERLSIDLRFPPNPWDQV